jgi:hypothetical protein
VKGQPHYDVPDEEGDRQIGVDVVVLKAVLKKIEGSEDSIPA